MSGTAVGTLGSHHEAVVDPRGRVRPSPDGWSLDWWIGADDRWHVPSREVAVRQRLIDDTPVVETAMRVPGGDAVQRVYGVRDGAAELLVVEIENRSSLPFAVALAVRDCTRVELLDDTTVTVDGRTAMLLPKRPSIVMDDGAGEPFPAELQDVAETAAAALLFPLAHTATLRVALPIDAMARTVALRALPGAAQVASGWQAHTARGLRLELPDPRLASCVAASRAHLLLRLPDDARALGALDRYGYVREVAEVLEPSPDLRAIGEHWRLHRDDDLVKRLAPEIAHRAEQLARKGPAGAKRALLDASAMLAAIGEARAAADAARLAAARPDDPADERRDLDWLQATLAAASPTWTWPDTGTAADVLTFVRDLLVRETADGLALCSFVPADWLGQGIEVHDAPTHAGTLSYAVRWHGDRPAVLWELDRHDGVADPRITVPGLDPTWSSNEPAGEALLGVVAPPAQVSAVSLRRR